MNKCLSSRGMSAFPGFGLYIDQRNLMWSLMSEIHRCISVKPYNCIQKALKDHDRSHIAQTINSIVYQLTGINSRKSMLALLSSSNCPKEYDSKNLNQAGIPLFSWFLGLDHPETGSLSYELLGPRRSLERTTNLLLPLNWS